MSAQTGGKLQGRPAIVTGAGRGIGRAIACALAREGAKVILAARSGAEIEAVAASLRDEGKTAWALPTDVSTEEGVRNLVRRGVELAGGASILVNNAGIGVFRKFADLAPADFDRMWGVNVRGVFLLTRELLPHLLRQREGDIVTIASLAGKNTFTQGAGYAATKWALRGMMGSLMLEVREHNIRTQMIFPGSVDTGFSVGGRTGDDVTQPGDVADAVLFAVTSPRRTMVSEIDLRPTHPR